VERTAKEELTPVKRHGRHEYERDEPEEKYKAAPSKGYFIMAKVGPSAHIDFAVSSIDATVGIINGFYLNEFISLGVGAHATQYTFNSNPTASVIAYPVFVDVRFYIPKRMVSPMFSFQLGYGFTGKRMLPTEQNTYVEFIPKAGGSGAYMAFSGGARVSITKTLSIIAEGSPTFQVFEGEQMHYVVGSGEEFEPAGKKTILSFQFNVGVSLSLGKKNTK